MMDIQEVKLEIARAEGSLSMLDNILCNTVRGLQRVIEELPDVPDDIGLHQPDDWDMGAFEGFRGKDIGGFCDCCHKACLDFMQFKNDDGDNKAYCRKCLTNGMHAWERNF